jgi:hypothetical protein
MVTVESAESEVILADLEMTRGLTIQLTAVGTLGMVVAWGLFTVLYEFGTGQAAGLRLVPPDVGWWAVAVNILVVVFLGTAFIIPHEWLHGLAIRYYGGKPRYGVGVAHFILPYAYATTEHEFSRNQFIVVLLTPLVVLTLVGVLLMIGLEWSLLIVPLTLNAAGAVADVWMALNVLSYPAHVRIVDHEGGVRILGHETDHVNPLSVTALVWDGLAGAAVAAFSVFVLVAIGGPLLLSTLGVESLTVGTPGRITYLFAFTNTPEEISFGVGPGVLVIGALVGLVYALVRTYRRRTPSNGDTM